ncbi:MAG: NADH-quinone oxidoreductase subunit J [Planctomycetota bacterium]|nr:NADH-quinone oxidoreductase subunit J [Planctomycetota bacterium]
MTESHFLAIGFWAFAILAAVPGIFILTTKNIIHAAFWLLASLLGFAGLYLIIGADFLAFTQVLVYVGGILILILFGVMLTHKEPVLIGRTPHHSNLFAGGVVSVFVLAGTVYMAAKTTWIGEEATPAPATALIGDFLMTKYILPFEVVSVLLLAALVGAAYIARGKEAVE